MDDVFQAASALKSAQLANKPGRREWELAPPFMRHTCGEYPEVVQARQQPLARRLAFAQELKNNGAQEFKKEEWSEALLYYSKSISVFLWFQRGKDRSIETVPLISEVPTEDSQERDQVTRHLCMCFTNASLCLTNQGMNDDAIYACNKALKYDPTCKKAYYRRAMCYHAKDTSTTLELAVKDLKIASRLDPSQTEIRTMLDHCTQELQAQNMKDKGTFGNMFAKGNLYTEADLQACKENVTPPDDGLFEPPFSRDAKEKARKMGIDLDDPRVQEALKNLKRDRLKRKDGVQKDKGLAGGSGERCTGEKIKQKPSYGFFSVMLDKKRWFSVPFFLYLALLLHFLYRMFKMVRVITYFDSRGSSDQTVLEDL